MPLWKQRMLEAIKAKDPAKHAAIKLDTITDDEMVNLHEAVCGPLVPEPGTQRVIEAQADALETQAEMAVTRYRECPAAEMAAA